jgi:hypothetical protein
MVKHSPPVAENDHAQVGTFHRGALLSPGGRQTILGLLHTVLVTLVGFGWCVDPGIPLIQCLAEFQPLSPLGQFDLTGACQGGIFDWEAILVVKTVFSFSSRCWFSLR